MRRSGYSLLKVFFLFIPILSFTGFQDSIANGRAAAP
jgi:hypothetical protein